MRAGFAMAAVVIGASLAAPGAHAAPPVPVRGTVVRLADDVLTVKPSEGADVRVDLKPRFIVRGLERKRLSDIHKGDYVASTGIKGTDGKLHAIEVRILPAARRGAGEGQFPWNLAPGSVMTNATVTGIAAAPKGETLTVTFNGKSSSYVVDPGTVILAYTKGSAAQLTPHAAVFLMARKGPDGRLVAAGVTAETNGIKPPM